MGRTWSFDDGKAAIYDWIRANVGRGERVLDVGPGDGGYGRMLRAMGYLRIDAVEAWEPNVREHRLAEVYDEVAVADVRSFEPAGRYGLVILGDVLEHLDAADAQAALARLLRAARFAVVSVPWRMEQGAVAGNPFEIHRQTDLTPEVMAARYPALRPLELGPRIGVYTAAGDAPPPAFERCAAHFGRAAPVLKGV